MVSRVAFRLTVLLFACAGLESVDEVVFKTCIWQPGVNVVSGQGSIKEFRVGSSVECAAACFSDPRCVASRYRKDPGGANSNCLLRNESGALTESEKENDMGILYFKPQGIVKGNKPSGFSKVGDDFLRISSIGSTYRDAEVTCAAYKGTVILSPTNSQIESTFKKLLTAYRNSTMKDGVWIGIDKRNSKKLMMASTGDDLSPGSFVGKFFSPATLGAVGVLEEHDHDCAKLVLLKDNSLGIKWENCSQTLYYVCQQFGRNFAAGKSGFVSGTNDTYVTTQVESTDGDFIAGGGTCAQTPAEDGPWILVDLAGHYVVHAVHIANCPISSESAPGFELRVGYNRTSINGNNLCKFFNNRMDLGAFVMLRCEPCPISGQYVTMQQIGGLNSLSVVEIEVYGSETIL